MNITRRFGVIHRKDEGFELCREPIVIMRTVGLENMSFSLPKLLSASVLHVLKDFQCPSMSKGSFWPVLGSGPKTRVVVQRSEMCVRHLLV